MKQINYNDPYLRKTKYLLETEVDQLKLLNENAHDIIIELKKKYNSYKQQDKVKDKYDESQFITYEQMIDKLNDSQLKCYYCQEDMVILFNKKREGKQWTLERFNNNLGHYYSNTCVACLQCNLKRRTDNHEYFKQGKQMKITKLDI